jgi:hypothetical protein
MYVRQNIALERKIKCSANSFNSSLITAMIGISGSYYFLGGIAMNIAGIAEFVLGNSMFLNHIFLAKVKTHLRQ